METTAKAILSDVPISTKQSIEIASFIRKKNLSMAKEMLNQVMLKKQAVPFRRFNRDMGHKPGIAAGRYPIKAVKYFLQLLNLAEANAQFKNLNVNNLMIKIIKANKGTTTSRYGRQVRRKAKRTNLEIVVEESKEIKK